MLRDDLLIPGSIPGLLRRGSPVRRGNGRGTVTHLSEHGWVIVHDDPLLYDHDGPGFSAGSGDVRHCGWALDLHDATGRAHAAWWLADRLLQVRGGSPVGWSCAGLRPWWLLYAEGDCRSFGLPGSGADYEVPGLDGVAWWLDGFDAPLALARVVAHVAGVGRG